MRNSFNNMNGLFLFDILDLFMSLTNNDISSQSLMSRMEITD